MKTIIRVLFFVLIPALGFTAEKDDENIISPFSLEAESYSASVQAIFENLPPITDANIIKNKVEGDESIIKSLLNNTFSGNLKYGRYQNVQIVGKTKIKVREPVTINNHEAYIWTAKGRVQYYSKNKKFEKPFFFVTHYQSWFGTSWTTDCILIENDALTLWETTLNAVAKVSTPIHQKKVETQYNEAIKKEEWEFNNRTINGKLVGYKHGKVSIQDGSKIPSSLDIMRFSIEDQILIRAYIDFLGIPVRDSQTKK